MLGDVFLQNDIGKSFDIGYCVLHNIEFFKSDFAVKNRMYF